MSRQSRLQIHRKGTTEGVFHSSQGSINPLSAHLSIGFDANELAELGDTDRMIASLGVLLHERHHWLQVIGTNTGVFHSLLLEVQSGVVRGYIHNEANDDARIPVLSNSGYDQFAIWWEGLELTRRMLNGCRVRDYENLWSDGVRPIMSNANRFLEELALLLVSGGTHEASVASTWSEQAGPVPKRVALVQHQNNLVGARHLMECAARQSEVFRILHAASQRGQEVFDLKPFYGGVYGVARSLYYESVDMGPTAAEIGLAYACDFGLQGLYPPLVPFGEHTRAAWTPGVRFAAVAGALASFDFSQQVDPFNPEEVRQILRQLDKHVEEKAPGLWVERRAAETMMRRVLAHLDTESIRKNLFTLDDEWPSPATRSGRLMFLSSLANQAFMLREENPEIFVFPICRYVDNRHEFRTYFESMQPPIISRGTSGIAPTDTRKGWLEYFIAAAVEYEVVRLIPILEIPDIATRLLPYAHTIGGLEHGTSVLNRALFQALPYGLASSIWQELKPTLGRV